jgi:pimeloyl-ACP methyl ester carboxylesterase
MERDAGLGYTLRPLRANDTLIRLLGRTPRRRSTLRQIVAPEPITREAALRRMERLNAIGHAVASVEYLARPRDRRRGGFNYWDVSKRAFHARYPRLAPVMDVMAKPAVTNALIIGRLAAAATLQAPVGRRTRGAADATLAVTSALMHPRQHYGTDGTDQVTFLVSTMGALARGARRPALIDAALWYVALQATLSYTVSGWVKLVGPSWRSGVALTGVTRTRTYGDERTWRLLTKYPRTARVLGVSVLLMECLFPVVFLSRGRLAPAWLLGTTLFHVGNARIMGLGRFVWAFTSLHPAVLYVSDARPRRELDGTLSAPRDDTLPRMSAAMLALALAAGVITQARRRQAVLRGLGDEERFVTSSGNDLALRRHGRADADGPVVVLEHAMLSAGEFWSWTADKLAERHSVVSYSRAGYSSSLYAPRDGYRLDRAVKDLLELARHVGGERGVVLVGHSLGGWIATRAAQAAPELVRGLVLVDSSHPDELERSSRQGQGMQAVTHNLQLMAPSLGLGLGALLERPSWIDRIPERMQANALAQYRDGRLWTAGLREWRATVGEFDAFDGPLPTLNCPVLSLTAGFTAAQDEIQLELHKEMAAMSADAEHDVIEGVTHDQVVFDRRAASRVAERIMAFLERRDA